MAQAEVNVKQTLSARAWKGPGNPVTVVEVSERPTPSVRGRTSSKTLILEVCTPREGQRGATQENATKTRTTQVNAMAP